MNKGQKAGVTILGIILALYVLSYGVLPFFTKEVYQEGMPTVVGSVLGTEQEVVPVVPEIVHIPTPDVVKGIYMSSCAAGTPSFRERLINIADTTEINSIIIDVKDYSGTLSFIPENPDLHEYVSTKCGVRDMKEFIKKLHEKNIYVIARITVFQDPFYTSKFPETAVKRASDSGIWKDRKGISYVDPGSHQAWDHTIDIAQASYDIGFDEINFDYIRFPSDGNMRDIAFPNSGAKSKPEMLESFFEYLYEHMKEAGIPTSADIFGMTTTNYDDLNIGQVLERALPYFDYVMPMVYPSHYPPNFNGWENPNDHVYDLIYYVMGSGVRRAVATSSPINTLMSERIGTSTPAVYTKPSWNKEKLRTWIQDFDYGGNYGAKEVRDQIQATYDVGLTSWIIWDPSNRYTIEGLLPDVTLRAASSTPL
jgi:hypothetical protein